MSGGIPLPVLQDWNRPFFEAGLSGKLLLQRCSRCDLLIYYPRMFCPGCLSDRYLWEEMSGLGTIYSFAIVWHPQHPAFEKLVPITLVIVDLQEGPQMVSTLINCAPEEASIGMRVRVIFDRVSDGIAQTKFEPVHPSESVTKQGR
jgi:uncharacterized OB-fold protein